VPFRGLTERQIEAGFRELSSKFVRSEYHSTYLHRALARFLAVAGGRYKFRDQLLDDIAIVELEQLRQALIDSLRSAYEKRQAVIAKLSAACSLPTDQIEERFALIDLYLKQRWKQGGNVRGCFFCSIARVFQDFRFLVAKILDHTRKRRRDGFRWW
jgi:hypothetical protein